MTIAEFKEEFLKCPYWDVITGGYDIMAIFLMGSRVTGCTDERSDYDLTIVCADDSVQQDKRFLLFKGHKVHWYFTAYKDFVQEEPRRPLWCYMNVLFGYVTLEYVLYINGNYKEQIGELMARKREIGLNGAKLFVETQKFLIDSIDSRGELVEQDFTKFLGHLCITKYFVYQEPVDVVHVLKAKRIRWQPTTKEDRDWIVLQLKMLMKWFRENP